MSDLITMSKKYKTNSGGSVEILRTGIDNTYSVVGVITYTNGLQEVGTWTKDGRVIASTTHPRPDDLVEETPYADFKKDDLCVTLLSGGEYLRYFAHANDLVAYVFNDGATSTTARHTIASTDCRKATADDIKRLSRFDGF